MSFLFKKMSHLKERLKIKKRHLKGSMFPAEPKVEDEVSC